MRRAFTALALAALFAASLSASAAGQTPTARVATPAASVDQAAVIAHGQALFEQHCASCHEPAIEGAPTRADLSTFDPRFISETLKNGEMKPMAKDFSDADIAAVVTFLQNY